MHHHVSDDSCAHYMGALQQPRAAQHLTPAAALYAQGKGTLLGEKHQPPAALLACSHIFIAQQQSRATVWHGSMASHGM
jgi:hypothetical protein